VSIQMRSEGVPLGYICPLRDRDSVRIDTSAWRRPARIFDKFVHIGDSNDGHWSEVDASFDLSQADVQTFRQSGECTVR